MWGADIRSLRVPSPPLCTAMVSAFGAAHDSSAQLIGMGIGANRASVRWVVVAMWLLKKSAHLSMSL